MTLHLVQPPHLLHDTGLDESRRSGGVAARSSHWPKVMHTFLLGHPTCAACSAFAPVAHIGHQVHHVHPFHLCILCGRPDLELDPRNLITLGETEQGSPAPNHHILLGHLDDFKSYNLSVVADCRLFMGMSTDQIKADPRWVSRERGRPADRLARTELIAFRKLLDRDLPPDPEIVGEFGMKISALRLAA